MRPILVAMALMLGACQTEAPAPRVPGAIAPEGDVVFTVNGSIDVHQNMYDAVMERIPPEQRDRMQSAPGGMKRLEEQMATSQLLYQRALEEGIAADPATAVGLAMAERDYLAAVYVQRHGEKAITDEAVAKAYEDRKVQYARPQVKARHILVKEESKAEELKAQLAGGADFAKLAEENSSDPGSKTKGGDLGWFERRRMDPAFADAAFTAELNTVVGPVSTRFGFHLIEVLEKRDSVPLDEVRDEIAGSLRQEAIQALLTDIQGTVKLKRPGEPEEAATPATPKVAKPPAGPPRPPGKPTKVKVKAPTAPPPGHSKDDGHDH